MAQTVRSEHTPSSAQPTTEGKQSLLGRVGNAFLSPRARSASRQKTGTGRFFMGMLILMIGSQVLFYVEAVVFTALHINQNAHLWAGNVPLLGGLTPFLLVYLVLIAALWYGLYRFKIIPRDPFGVKAQQAARANATTATSSIPGVRKTRSDRRQAAIAASSTPAKGNAKTAKAAPETEITPREHDATYQQVREMQKARRRREVKR